jgi:hypothetical protein
MVYYWNIGDKMAVFVHFTDENNKNSIIKNGIKPETIHYETIKKGIFCMPVIPDFYATHQWVRELKQYKSGNEMIAVYFKIPDEELVFCGKYNEAITETNASETHNRFMNLDDKMGFQTIIGRKILPKEITKVKNIPQIIGWRHFPKSHERKRCLCPACLTKGSYNSINTKKKKIKDLFKNLRNADGTDEMEGIFSDIFDLRIKNIVGTKEEKILIDLMDTDDENKKNLVLYRLALLYGGNFRDEYKNYCFQKIYEGESIDDIENCLSKLCSIYGSKKDKDNILKIDKILNEIKIEKCTNEVIKIINEYKE